jgi:hypothetical protein
MGASAEVSQALMVRVCAFSDSSTSQDWPSEGRETSWHQELTVAASE